MFDIAGILILIVVITTMAHLAAVFGRCSL